MWYIVSKLVLTFCEKKKFTEIEQLERPEQFLKQNAFLTYSWRFLRPNKLEFRLENMIGIQKYAGKVRKNYLENCSVNRGCH